MNPSGFGDSTGHPRIGSAPSRSERILHDLLEMAQLKLNEQMARVFDEANDDLFKRAEKATSNDVQQNLFEAMREIKRRRIEFDLNFSNLLRDSFVGLPERAKRFRIEGNSEPKPRDKSKLGLKLIDNSDLEESLVLDELTAKAEIKQSQELWALSQRLGVLAGTSALDLSLVPAGPHSLAQTLRQAALVFDMPVASKVMIYKIVDREVMGKLGELLASMNEQLARAKILPNLTFDSARAESDARADPAEAHPEPPAQSAQSELAEQNPPENDRRATAGFANKSAPTTQTPRQPGQGRASAGAQSAGTADISASEAMHALANAFASLPSPSVQPANLGARESSGAPQRSQFSLPGGLGELNQAHQASAATEQSVARDAELFETMRELLGGRRRAMASFGRTADAPTPNAKPVSGEDVQSVLSVLQTKPHAISIGGRSMPRTISHIKQEMTQALRSLDPKARQPQLSELDSDTFDLVGMLFDFVLKDVGREGVTHNMLTRLQVPVLKVALKDKGFFTSRQHPARAFLNAIAEAGQLWAEHDDGDTHLVENMQILVERALEEFDQDTHVFEDLLGDLTKHINVLTRKADVSERRHVEASKGRERLDLAKQEAQAAVTRLVNERQPPKMVQQLLEQAWADVLSLLSLRHGAQSPEYADALKIADQMIDSVTPNQGGERRRELRNIAKGLNERIERGLAQVGFAESEGHALIKNLEGCQAWALAEGQTLPIPQQLFKPIPVVKTRLGKDAESNKKDAVKAPPMAPLTREEQAMFDRIRQIPFGTWFDFVVNQQGLKARRKLSWFSPVSSKCLFVNARGMKVDELSMETLAREMVRGVAMTVDESHGTLIDRAFGTIMRTLKQLTQRPQAAQAAT